jgi:polyhydroxyalkanoate synthase
MSFAGLTQGWTASNNDLPLSKPLRRLSEEQNPQNPNAFFNPSNAVAFVDALTREAKARMEQLSRGIQRYQTHPYRRTRTAPPAVWRRGSATLHAYGGNGSPAVFVPSLINRAYILDLAEDRSLMATAAARGIRPYLLDWGAPGNAERQFSLEDYILGVLVPALEHVAAETGEAPRLVGYCMGGTLAVAAAVVRPELVSRLALLAAPWDFHADSGAARMFLDQFRPCIEMLLDMTGVASVDLLQALFASLDPTLVSRKFRAFAARDVTTDAARRFVELEDWLNDGVDLAGPVAREALYQWYGENAPLKKQWRVDGQIIDPQRIRARVLALLPSHDRIVPPTSAQALAAAIPGCETHQIDLGHVGMMAGGNAVAQVYTPLAEWLERP